MAGKKLLFNAFPPEPCFSMSGLPFGVLVSGGVFGIQLLREHNSGQPVDFVCV